MQRFCRKGGIALSFHAILVSVMRLLIIAFAFIAVIVVVGSFYADYKWKWRQWMAARRRDREHHQ